MRQTRKYVEVTAEDGTVKKMSAADILEKHSLLFDADEPESLYNLQTYENLQQLGAPIPKDLQNWINNGFSTFLNAGGELSMEKAFGLVGKEGGQGAFSKCRKINRTHYMFLLSRTPEFKQIEAARLVVNRELHWGHTELDPETVAKDYRIARRAPPYDIKRWGLDLSKEIEILESFDVPLQTSDRHIETALKKL